MPRDRTSGILTGGLLIVGAAAIAGVTIASLMNDDNDDDDDGNGDPKPVSDPHGNWVYKPQYSDEFNANALNTAKWNNDYRDFGDWSWEPDNAYVAGGYLHLRMRYEPHVRDQGNLFYKSGIITTWGRLQPILYGYFEVRLKTPPLDGPQAGFWLNFKQPDIPGLDGITVWHEIDIAEMNQLMTTDPNFRRRVGMNLHMWRDPEYQNGTGQIHESRSFYLSSNSREDFHVYGLEWSPDEINWYVDGIRRRTRENDFFDVPEHILCSMAILNPLATQTPTPIGFPTEALYDYIRVWQRP
jgi:beta-glucanase (GH16 family)